ncbi:MAG: PIN domain-containing protein [Pseudomonadota bacterium]
MTQSLFLDACVLFPPLVRGLLLESAAQGVFCPLWSERVLEEWRIAVARQHGPDGESGALRARAAMTAAFPGAIVPAEADLETTINLPDPADAHVVAAAAGRAEGILTFNLRDFPARVLAAHGLEARHPDSFLWEALSVQPETIAQVIEGVLPAFGIDPAAAKAPLKRALLPRLAKAWAAPRP